jgi:hypothetical protein
VPVHQVLSIDEMVCKPWKNEATLAGALRLGQSVQESIREHCRRMVKLQRWSWSEYVSRQGRKPFAKAARPLRYHAGRYSA